VTDSDDEEPTFTDEDLARFLEEVKHDSDVVDSDSEFIQTVIDLYLRARAQVELDGKELKVSREQAHEVGLAIMRTYLDARDPDELWIEWLGSTPGDEDDD
jgi:hypothetical protein